MEKMKTLTIENFSKSEDDFVYDTKYDDKNLYIVRNNESILYIGISETCIWSRWFSQRGSHMFFGYDFSLHGTSRIGKEIEDNIPNSLLWNIDLWSGKDALDFLEIKNSWDDEKGKYKIFDPFIQVERLCDVRYVETLMIRYIHPKYNSMGNNWSEPNQYFLEKYLKLVS